MPDLSEEKMAKLKQTFKAVMIAVTCDYCKGQKRLPGGTYKDQGEVINCPVCDGKGMEACWVTPEQFRKLIAP